MTSNGITVGGITFTLDQAYDLSSFTLCDDTFVLLNKGHKTSTAEAYEMAQ